VWRHEFIKNETGGVCTDPAVIKKVKVNTMNKITFANSQP
jgi:hypothetical protein